MQPSSRPICPKWFDEWANSSRCSISSASWNWSGSVISGPASRTASRVQSSTVRLDWLTACRPCGWRLEFKNVRKMAVIPAEGNVRVLQPCSISSRTVDPFCGPRAGLSLGGRGCRTTIKSQGPRMVADTSNSDKYSQAYFSAPSFWTLLKRGWSGAERTVSFLKKSFDGRRGSPNQPNRWRFR